LYREKIAADEDIAATIAEYIEQTGLLQMYKEMATDEALDRWENVIQLLTDIKMYFRNNDEGTLSDYIQQISLLSDIDEKDLQSGNLTLMTVHSAKGLEFPVVIISGLERGLFPLQRADMPQEEEEEERRLFYVGVTRAKEKLILTFAERRARFGAVTEQSPSNFLREIPADLIHRPEFKKATSPNINPKASQSINRTNNRIDGINQIPEQEFYSQIEPGYSFNVGDVVKHSHFGKGKIMHLSGAGKNLKAVIKFESVGNKNLMLEYAKLEKL
jgi:DNA helicase-2/ATP-dependent DNA helicase PcrA